MTSQADAVLLYLQSGRELTPLEALQMFGCLRLAARIQDLREQGYAIETREERRGRKRVAAYRLRQPVQCDLFGLSVPTATGSAVLAGERGGPTSMRTGTTPAH